MKKIKFCIFVLLESVLLCLGQSNTPPEIQSFPSRTIISQGSTLSLVATVTGYPLNYFWYFNDTKVGTNISYSITNVQLSNEGFYSLLVTNKLGAASATVPVTVVTTNILTNCIVSTNTSVTFEWCPLTNITNYNIYYGQLSTNIPNWTPDIWATNDPPCPSTLLTNGANWYRTYTVVSNVGNVLTSTISGIPKGYWTFFAATAVDANGLEGKFSGEVEIYIPPATNPVPTFSVYMQSLWGYNAVSLQTKICPNQNARIWYKTSLVATNWTLLASVVSDSYGNIVYDDSTTNATKKFYSISVP
jgi:hypothetical protein